MAEYDKIAEDYSQIEEIRPERKYYIDPSFLKALGNVNGKKIMDLACGSGYMSRKIKKAGAKEIVGVDISKEMIKIGKDNPENKGIRFILGDAIKLKKIDEFDIVTAAFLLHYSKNKKELFEMCKSIYKNLKEGGIFLTINNNPLHPKIDGRKYGVVISGPATLKEGDELKVCLTHDPTKNVSFSTYYWKKETYEKALKEAGFKKIEWIDAEIQKEAIEELGKEYWSCLKDNNYLTIIRAYK
jgi:toxoflavin synthase